MTRHTSRFAIRLAATRAEIEAAQALRHRVFVEELGAAPDDACAGTGREWDRFDGACDHLILTDALRGDAVVGAYRLMDEAGAARAGGFASEEEFDLAPLRRSGLALMELGRTCLHPDYRGGSAIHLLWQALAGIVAERRIGLVFGLASLPGTNLAALAGPLGLLASDHLAPAALRPVCRDGVAVPEGALDRVAATVALPALVKGYLRLGGKVGEGAFLDRRFGCVDVCMVLGTGALAQGRGAPPGWARA